MINTKRVILYPIKILIHLLFVVNEKKIRFRNIHLCQYTLQRYLSTENYAIEMVITEYNELNLLLDTF